MAPTWTPNLIVFLSASLWGLYWLPLRIAEEDGLTGPWPLVAISAFPLLILLPLIWQRRAALSVDWGRLSAIGFLIGAGLTCYGFGLIYTTILRATLLYYLTPVWSTLFAMLILGECTRWGRWLAIAMGLLGLGFMLSSGESSWTSVNLGDLMGLASGVFWGLGATLLRRHPSLDPRDSVITQYIYAFLFALGLAVLLEGWDGIPQLEIWWRTSPVIGITSCLFILPSLFAIVWASQRLSPGRVGILMMSEVLVAGISAPLLAGEPLQLRELLGAIFILGAGIVELASQPRLHQRR